MSKPDRGDAPASWGQALAEGAMLVAVALVPVWFDPFSQRVFEPDKALLLRLMGLLMAVGLAFSLRRRPPLLAPVAAVLAATALSSAFSVNPVDSWSGSYERAHGFLTLAACALAGITAAAGPLRSDLLARTLVAASLPPSLFAILQRLGQDPIWHQELSERVTGTMGNPVLLGAWLLMVMPITAARVSRSREGALCAVALTLQTVALLWSGSRGPLLGLLAGGGLAILALGAAWRRPASPAETLRAAGLPLLAAFLGFGLTRLALRLAGVAEPHQSLLAAAVAALVVGVALLLALDRRKAWLGWVVALSLGAALLLAVNLPKTALQDLGRRPVIGGVFRTLEGWRTVPQLSRVTRLAEAGGRTGQVRLILWGGTVDLLTAREPLTDWSGRPDRWAALRPWLGYGPETLWQTFLRFQPPELATVERRTSVADRSHNEFLDVAAFGGLLGLAAWQWLYGAAVWKALEGLGLGAGGRLFAGLWLGGGLAAAATAGAFEPALAGVALAAGNLAGTLLYLALAPPPDTPPADLLPAALLAAVAGHLVEVQFGFTTVATGLTFFLAAGWLAHRDRSGGTDGDTRPPAALLGLILAALAIEFVVSLPALTLSCWVLGALLFPRAGRVLLLSGLLGLAALGLVILTLAARQPDVLPVGMAAASALAALVLAGRPPPAALPALALAFLAALPLVAQVRADIAWKRAKAHPAEALVWMRRAVALWPSQASYRVEVASRLLGQAREDEEPEPLWRETEEHLRAAAGAMALHPAVPAGLGDLAVHRASRSRGDERRRHLEEARRHYEAASRMAPANVLMTNEYVSTLLRLGGDAEGAIAAFRRSLAVDPTLGETWIGLAEATVAAAGQVPDEARRNELYAQAAEAFLAGAERLRDRLKAATHQIQASRLYTHAGRHPEAAEAWAEAEEAADPRLLGWKGLAAGARVYLAAGRREEAAQRARAAVERAPEADRPGLRAQFRDLLP